MEDGLEQQVLLARRARACVDAVFARGDAAFWHSDLTHTCQAAAQRRLSRPEALVVAAAAGDAPAVRKALPSRLCLGLSLLGLVGRTWHDAVMDAAHIALVCDHVDAVRELAPSLAPHPLRGQVVCTALLHGASLETAARLLPEDHPSTRWLVKDDPRGDVWWLLNTARKLRTMLRLRRWRSVGMALELMRREPLSVVQRHMAPCLELADALRAERAARALQRAWRWHCVRRRRVLAAWALTRGQPALTPEVARVVCEHGRLADV